MQVGGRLSVMMISRIDEAKNDLIISEREAWVSSCCFATDLVTTFYVFFFTVFILPFLEETISFFFQLLEFLKSRKTSMPCGMQGKSAFIAP